MCLVNQGKTEHEIARIIGMRKWSVHTIIDRVEHRQRMDDLKKGVVDKNEDIGGGIPMIDVINWAETLEAGQKVIVMHDVDTDSKRAITVKEEEKIIAKYKRFIRTASGTYQYSDLYKWNVKGIFR